MSERSTEGTALVSHIKKQGCPFQRSYAAPPPNSDIVTEDNVKQFLNFTLDQIRYSKLKSNITPVQRQGLKSLLSRRDILHLSVSDKGG